MKRIALLLAVGVLASGCRGGEKPRLAGDRTGLSTAIVVERAMADAVEIEGTIVGRQEAVLASRLSAPVLEVLAVPGQVVRAGAVLVRLEPRETEGALESARGALSAAHAAHEIAEKNRVRFERLFADDSVAQIDLDRTVQEEAARRSEVAAAEAALRRAEIDRTQAALAAPFDAIVVEKMVAAGDLAYPGRPLVRLACVSGRRVEAAPSEDQAARLSPGDAVRVILSSGELTGRVAEVVGAVDPATRRRTVRIDLPVGSNPAVGSFARILLSGPAVPRLYVPTRAVIARGGLQLAWTVEPDGRAALRYIRTGGASAGDLVEIRSGLQPGDRVVLDPPADLESGARVRS